ncbi:MAG: penicillin-binding transpeptidase domain-containing protein [Polyangia bacterium]|jgi:cell division protein FtsI (penicillin-binding protein 3)|nr:penicillin-binding transpeptidase domain-containing protein [Polyangia bacterium]
MRLWFSRHGEGGRVAGEADPNRWVRFRVRVALGLFFLLLLAIGHRAFGLQLVHGKHYRERAQRQAIHTVKLPPKRGPILDRHGNRLAVSVDVPSVYANPREVGERAQEMAQELAKILDTDRFLLAEKLSSRRFFVWVKRRVTPKQAQEVEKLRVKGIYLTRESRRFYPNRRLAGSVLGFSGLDGSGLEGVEKSFDSWLRGSRSTISGLRDAHGKLVFIEGRPDLTPAAGHTVMLTIDKKIQFITENALRRAVELYRAKGGTAVVMDPGSGDLLAMASMPDFDPNNVQAADPESLRNRAAVDAYEPGSTLKIFTMAAALEHRVVRLGEQIFCENGMIEIGRHKIKDSHPHKWLDLAGIIQKSSNIGATKIGQRLGKRRLYTALRLLGFGHRSGLLLPGERSGDLEHWRRWSEAKLSNVSFGQGITATTVQLAAALSAIANGGMLYRPRLVLEIRDANSSPLVQYRKHWRRVISSRVTGEVMAMMRTVVEKGGTGEEAAIEGYTVAGKTGTAQKVAESSVKRAQALAQAAAEAALEGRAQPKKSAGYSDELYHASFIGVVPATRPRLVIVVVVDEPQGEYYGGTVAGPVFRQIGEEALRYLGVPRDEDAEAASRKKKPRPIPLAPKDGLIQEEPRAPALPATAPEGPIFNMPDLSGLSLKAAVERLRGFQVDCQFLGSGRVVTQEPAPGPARRDAACKVVLTPPG